MYRSICIYMYTCARPAASRVRGAQRGLGCAHAGGHHSPGTSVNYLAEMWSGSEGEIFKAHRLLYHSTLGMRVIKKNKEKPWRICTADPACRTDQSEVPIASVARSEGSAARMRAGTTLQARANNHGFVYIYVNAYMYI